MLHDLRFALRILSRTPAFTLVAILSLALGIGANTAIFSLLDQVLFRLLPVRDQTRIVAFHIDGLLSGRTSTDNSESVLSHPMYRDFRDRAEVFDGLIARSSAVVNIATREQPEQSSVEIVSGNFFDVLGVHPAVGRLLSADDDITPGGHPVIVLSHGYWTRKFAASTAILNQTVRVNGLSMTVVGVIQPNFRGIIAGQSPDLYAPIAMKAQLTPDDPDKVIDRRYHWLTVFGRLKPGVSRVQASTALAPFFHALLEQEIAERNLPARMRERVLSSKLSLRPGSQGVNQLQAQWERPLIAVMAMAGLVLLIACANVANLLISRAAARWKEIAIRRAIGASRWALIRQLLVESLSLSLAGGAVGLLLSYWIAKGLISLAPGNGMGGWIAAEVDLRVLAFTFLISLVTGLLFGLAPAISVTRSDVASALKDQGGALAKVRLRNVLVAAQMALSLVLLIAAGLFVRSLTNLMHANLGFRPERLLVFRISPALQGYKAPEAMALFDRLQDRLRSLPGVVSVAAAQMSPLSGGTQGSDVTVEGYKPSQDEDTHCLYNWISPAYFSTLGAPLLAGREFTAADSAGAQHVAIVNETFARHFFQNQNPIGRHMANKTTNGKLDIEIVGVVRNSVHTAVKETTARFFYIPYMQQPSARRMSFFVRTGRDDNALPKGVRNAVREIDSNMPVTGERWMTEQVESSVSIERLIASLAAAFGALATLLATVGLYGVMAYMIARRTAEIGIRIALGATPLRVIGMVMRDAGVLSAAGLAVGIPSALGAGRLIEAQLFGVRASNLPVILGAASALAVAAMVAAYLPARRAARIDPLRALRVE